MRVFIANCADISEKTQQYNEYIAEHRANVKKAWKEMQIKCVHEPFIVDDWTFHHFDYMIDIHDLSKYSAEEFTQYRRNFYPCDSEEKDEAEFETAWRHHYENNCHHWEYWTDKLESHNYIGEVEQTLAYAEMVCDWTAMGYKFGGTALDYYEKIKHEIRIQQEYIGFFERLLHMMKEEIMQLIDAGDIKNTAILFPLRISEQLDATVEAIDKAPTIEAAPVVYGMWEYRDMENFRGYACSVCGTSIYSSTWYENDYNYCPNCGAKMNTAHA